MSHHSEPIAGSEVYAELMIELGHGMPLWYPDGTNWGEITIGDVGYTFEGRFYRLFNILHPASHTLNSRGVPKNFKPLEIDEQSLVTIIEGDIPRGPIGTRAISHREIHTGISAGTSPTQRVLDASYTFTCSGERAAVAVIRDAATQARLAPCTEFKEYLENQHESVWEFAKYKKHNIPYNALVIISGWVKTTEWALAVMASQGRTQEVSLSAYAGGYASAEFSCSSGEIGEAVLARRAGPSRRSSHHESSGGVPTFPKDQCLFINYYKLTSIDGAVQREDASDIRLATRESQSFFSSVHDWYYRKFSPTPSPQPDSGSSSSELGGKQSHSRGTDQTGTVDPLDYLLRYIIEASDARSAIASHDDLYALFKPMQWPTDLLYHLHRNAVPVGINERGVGHICCGHPHACDAVYQSTRKASKPRPIPGRNDESSEDTLVDHLAPPPGKVGLKSASYRGGDAADTVPQGEDQSYGWSRLTAALTQWYYG